MNSKWTFLEHIPILMHCTYIDTPAHRQSYRETNWSHHFGALYFWAWDRALKMLYFMWLMLLWYWGIYVCVCVCICKRSFCVVEREIFHYASINSACWTEKIQFLHHKLRACFENFSEHSSTIADSSRAMNSLAFEEIHTHIHSTDIFNGVTRIQTNQTVEKSEWEKNKNVARYRKIPNGKKGRRLKWWK